MSSFEQFKKSQHHSRSHRSSRLSFKSFEADVPNLANVSFNTNEIIFRWNEAQDTLVNQELRVANRTGARLYFQIAADHYEFYDIRPNQDILEVESVANITFRLNKKKIVEQGDRALSPLNRLKAFLKNNAIQFSWGEITEENIKYNEIPPSESKQKLLVRVEGGDSGVPERDVSQRSASVTKKYNQEQSVRENQMMGEPKGFDESNRVIISSEETGEYSSLLTIPIIAAVAFCSFVLGFVSA